MDTTVSELTTLLSAQLLAGKPETRITGFASLADAQPGDLSFFSDPRYKQLLEKTKAAALLVPEGWSDCPPNIACLSVPNPSESFGKVVHKFGFHHAPFQAGIHP